jgi:hypothetical protein
MTNEVHSLRFALVHPTRFTEFCLVGIRAKSKQLILVQCGEHERPET